MDAGFGTNLVPAFLVRTSVPGDGRRVERALNAMVYPGQGPRASGQEVLSNPTLPLNDRR